MKILITGHKGFLGRNFNKALDTKKNTIYGLDVKDKTDCKNFFDTTTMSFDLVLHFAAVVGGREVIDTQPLALSENLSIDEKLFRWAIKTKPKKILYVSSSAAYPVFLQTKKYKLKESDREIFSKKNFGMPDKIYGWAKITGELLASTYAQNYGGSVCMIRPFSGYGIDQDIDYPFPAFVQRAKAKENPFIIWGNGKQVRDFIHVDDIVKATLVLLKDNITKPINIGTGIPTSFRDLAQMITKQAGYTPTYSFLYNKPTGVSYRVADTTLLKKFYTPKITLEEGIRRAFTL